MQAIPFCVASNIQPLFMKYVIDGVEGATLSSFSLIFTIGALVSAVAAPFIGKMYSKFNVKTMFLAGAILSGGSFALFSLCTEMWHFYIVQAICQVGTAVFSSIGVPLLITNWFDESQKGKALGIAFAGGSLGNIAFQFITVTLLESIGFSMSYLVFGIISVVVGTLVALLIIRNPKNDAEKITGDSDNSGTKEPVVEKDWGYTLKEAMKLPLFWFCALGFLFVGLYVAATSTQDMKYIIETLKTYFEGNGSTIEAAGQEAAKLTGLVGSTFAVSSLLGNLIGGSLFDKLGVKISMIIPAVLMLAGVFALMSIDKIGPIGAFAFCIPKVLAVYAYMIGPSYLVGSFFGKKEFGTILGIIQIFFAVGFASGSILFAKIVEGFGYNFAWITVLVFVAIAYSLLVIAAIGLGKLRDKRIKSMS